MKKKIIVILLLITTIAVTGCTNDAKKFKEEYEAINDKVNKKGLKHRKISINKKNPFIYSNSKEIIKKIENKETFYVYFGSKLCPWCRSVIEQAIESANNNDIKKIYYVDIWDDKGNEILRDKYLLNDDELELTEKGTKEYKKLLEYFDNVLNDYNIIKEDGNIVSTNEKRIYAPNFIYVKDGKAIKLVEGMSDLQEDSRGELTEKIKDDQINRFNNFFNNKKRNQ